MRRVDTPRNGTPVTAFPSASLPRAELRTEAASSEAPAASFGICQLSNRSTDVLEVVCRVSEGRKILQDT